MSFISQCLQTFLEQWFIPISICVAGGYIIWKIQEGQPLRQIIAKMAILLPLLAILSTVILTVISNNRNKFNPQDVISVTDITFEKGTRGLASLYDDKIMPIWFESDLDDVWLDFMVDNTGESYANIKKTRLIVDDFQPVSMDDILLIREEAFAGVPSKASADIDLSDIKSGRSVYDINFTAYNDYNTGMTIPLEKGQTFNVDQSSQTRLVTFLGLKKSGIYTYHIEVNYEYYRKTGSMETVPISFIYIEGDSADYQFDNERLDSFHIDRTCKDEYSEDIINYSLEGRTLRIHDTDKIFTNNDLGDYFSLVNNIIVEDGTKIIEAFAFGCEPGLYNTRTVYLPKSLEYLDVNCFYFSDSNLKTICFGGTEEEWDYLISNSESDRIEIIEDVEILFDYDLSTYEEECLYYQEDEGFQSEDNEPNNTSTAIITGVGKKSGVCSASPHDNVKWELTGKDEDMTLTITGNGAMASFDDSCEGPWGERSREIRSIIIENGVTNIGNYAFINFENLTNVSIANSVKNIGNIAFWGCQNLDTVDIPNGVEDIGECAFAYCYCLNNITLSESVINIGEWAFDYCYNITTITIPSSIKKVGTNAFFACDGLKQIYFEGNAPEFGEEVFSGVDAIVYYPQNDSTWSDSVKQQYGGVIEWSPWNLNSKKGDKEDVNKNESEYSPYEKIVDDLEKEYGKIALVHSNYYKNAEEAWEVEGVCLLTLLDMDNVGSKELFAVCKKPGDDYYKGFVYTIKNGISECVFRIDETTLFTNGGFFNIAIIHKDSKDSIACSPTMGDDLDTILYGFFERQYKTYEYRCHLSYTSDTSKNSYYINNEKVDDITYANRKQEQGVSDIYSSKNNTILCVRGFYKDSPDYEKLNDNTSKTKTIIQHNSSDEIPTSTTFSELKAKELSKPAIFHCIEKDLNEWNPEMEDKETFWDVICFYCNFTDWINTVDYSRMGEYGEYKIIPNDLIENAAYAFYKDFDGNLPAIEDNIQRAHTYNENSTGITIGDTSPFIITSEKYQHNKDGTIDAEYETEFSAIQSSAGNYKVHFEPNLNYNNASI